MPEIKFLQQKSNKNLILSLKTPNVLSLQTFFSNFVYIGSQYYFSLLFFLCLFIKNLERNVNPSFSVIEIAIEVTFLCTHLSMKLAFIYIFDEIIVYFLF